MFTFAPTTAAAKVLRKEGFGNAATLQSLIISEESQAQIKGGVLLVDEAGMIGVPQMKRLMEVAAAQGARVALIGDGQQHGSVERSDVNVLHILERHAGLAPFTLSDIRRQRDAAYRAAVADLSCGRIAEGFDKLEAIGAFREVEDDAARYGQIAEDYLALAQEGKEVLIVSPTHAEGAAVNDAVRRRLKDAGLIEADEHSLPQWANLNATIAERRQARFYAPGMMVGFVRGCAGFKVGERLTVTGRDEDGYVIAETTNGDAVRLPLTQAECFQVFEERRLNLAVGDLVRLTKNGFGVHGEALVNGTIARVDGFTNNGDITLEDGTIIEHGFGHLTYGYCLTSHASQGRTVDAVLVAQSSLSAGAASPEQVYVSVSRAREEVRIYTDDAEAMKDTLTSGRHAMSATDVLKSGPEAEDPDRPRRIKVYQKMMNVHWRRKRERLRQAAEATRSRSADLIGTLRSTWARLAAPLSLSRPSIHWRPAP